MILQAGLAVSGGGELLLLTVHTPFAAVVTAAGYGVGTGAAFPAIAALLGSATPPVHRPTAFAVQYALNNVGFSVGAVVGALLVSFTDPASFDRLYVLDAATFLAFAGWLSIPMIRGRHEVAARPGPAADGGATRDGYRKVLSDNNFLRFCVVNVLLVVFAFSQFHAALPAIVGGPGLLSAARLGVVFAANTVTVVLVQLPILRWSAGRTRTVAIVLGAAAFAACWVLVWFARRAGGGTASLAFAAGGAAVMAVGEALLSPALGPIVNDLAPEHLRGRYNAVDTVVLSVGSILGPGLTGLLLGSQAATVLLVVLAAGCLAAAAMSTRLHFPTREETNERRRSPL